LTRVPERRLLTIVWTFNPWISHRYFFVSLLHIGGDSGTWPFDFSFSSADLPAAIE